MRIIRGATNQWVMADIDVYLDGKLLDAEHHCILMADDRTGEVEYAMFEQDAQGNRQIVTEKTDNPPQRVAGMTISTARRKVFKAKGRVDFDVRPYVPTRELLVIDEP
jgi:hypothetical protein